MNITPIGERIIIEQTKKKEKTESGIYLPEDAQKERKQGIVLSVGTFKDGKPLPIGTGDRVLYGGYSHEEIDMDGKKYVLVEFKDVMAKLGGAQ
jgi:chaperonin GroES